ncbi:MAG: two-component system, cell cycle sensor histidine kinase and response regulator CckA [Thermodesulfobacteriota bacterium]|nr:two-component system, cell cycle sensor histidine kinase and response regulator CckA [Thermodesulfobacteriota bacterium]
MKKRTLFLLISSFAGVCVVLFYAFYNEAKKTAFEKLNEEQMIHAKQAARGIEEFFKIWTGILTSFARMDAIINNDTRGKLYMDLFLEAHQEQILSITRVDENGTIICTVPFNLLIGTNISDQKHVQEILRDHKPVVSDVFKTVQGFYAVALHVPVFKGPSFKGTISILINFESLAKRYLGVIEIGQTGYAWVVSRDGTQLYSPFQGFTGKSVYENYKDFPSIMSMVEDMLRGRQGIATYTFDKIGQQTVAPVRLHAVYLPINIGATFWSIAVVSSETEVLSTLSSFRNRLILVIGVIFIGGMFFSIVGAKAWFVLAEEEKRKQIEKELRSSEQRYRQLFEHNPAPILIYERGTLKILAVNGAFTDHYGYSYEKALSLHLTDIYPEDEKVPITRLAAALQGPASVGEWRHLKADGSIISIVARSEDIDYERHNARIAVISDITERKQMENALRHSEERFFKAFHATPDAIVISRAVDGHLFEVNDVFLTQTGYSRDEVINRTTVDLKLWVDPNDREQYGAAVREQGAVRDMEARFRTKSGKILDGLVSGESIVLDSELCLLTIIRDITERKRIEGELDKHRLHLEDMVSERTWELEQSQKALQNLFDDMSKAKTELEAANERLRELDRLKSLFIASMSHELRTPLNSIIGFTGILLQEMPGPLNDEQKKQLGMVKKSSLHLLGLITDIIDLSKIEAGKIEITLAEFDLMNVVREVAALSEPAAGRKGIAIDLDGPETLDLKSDQRRVRQVLVNLVGNAVKFTESGKVIITVAKENGKVNVKVQDTGLGIRAEDMTRLFQFFSRITSVDMPQQEGTGLGLYLSKKLMNLLGGDILAESELGRGSAFSISLPASQ